MKKLKIESLFNNIHFLVIPIILSALIFYHYIFIFILLIYLIFIYKKRIFIYPIFIISIVTILIYALLTNYKYNTSSSHFTGVTLQETIKDDNTYELIVLTKKGRVLVYTKTYPYKVGDKLTFQGKYNTLKEESYQNGFNYKEYLRNKKIYASFTASEITYHNHYIDINYLRNKIINHYKNNYDELTYSYLSSLVFADNTLNENTNDEIKNIGISHIFCVSGYHVNLLVLVLSFLLLKLFKKEQTVENIIIVILLFYVYLCGFTIPIIRASSMIIMGYLFKRYKIPFTKLDILFLSILIVIIFNPYSLYQVSFWLTYLLTFVIIIYPINDDKSSRKAFRMTFLCFLVSLPIIINLNNKINYMTLILTPVFLLITSYLLIPYLYLLLIIPFINTKYIIKIFEIILTKFSNINYLSFHIPDISIYIMLLYYIVLIIILIRKENHRLRKIERIIFMVFIFFIQTIRLYIPYTLITFIDVGQGDSTLISLNNNRGNMVIDTFGYNLSYLKDMGINKLDYLILTHSDIDHIANYQEVLNELKVKHLITSYYDDIPNSTKVKADDEILFDNIRIRILGPINNSDNKNDISIVFILSINKFKIMFTGDMGVKEELDLVNRYSNNLESDFIKVGHHGSNTSSSKMFIDKVNPKASFISVGTNNKYGHPNIETLNTLNKTDIYRTDKSGNINLYIYKNKYKIKPYR